MARSGSNLLTDGLHATRLAGRPKQFFLPKFEQEYALKAGLESSSDFGAYVRRVVCSTATSNEVFGFKLMGWYLKGFLDRLRQVDGFGGESSTETALLEAAFPRLRYVHIRRRDKVRQAISKAKALQCGLWKVQAKNSSVREPVYDEELISRCVAETRKDEEVWQQFFNRNGIQPHLVEYENMVEDYEGTIRGVLDFLKIRLSRGQEIAPPKTVPQADLVSREWEQRYKASYPSVTEEA